MKIYIHPYASIYTSIYAASFFQKHAQPPTSFCPVPPNCLSRKWTQLQKNLLSWLFTVGYWVLYEAGPWWYTWWTQKLSPEAIINNKAMLLVDCNKQLSMAETFSVFFKHLFGVIVISTIPQPNTTMVSFYILQVEGVVLCKGIDVFYGNWYRESYNFRIERWRRADVLSEGNRILF